MNNKKLIHIREVKPDIDYFIKTPKGDFDNVQIHLESYEIKQLIPDFVFSRDNGSGMLEDFMFVPVNQIHLVEIYEKEM